LPVISSSIGVQIGETYLPRPSDQFPGSDILPPAELNPLLNPILAENMGRWAEVYFTTPPEKREEAVLELLRELQAKNARQAATLNAPVAESQSGLHRSPGAKGSSTLEQYPALIRCRACGRDNPASHKFCGMCGADLRPPEADFRSRTGPHAADDSGTQHWNQEPESDSRGVEPSPVNTNELSLFQTVRGGDSDELDWDYEPSRAHPYRFFIGVILAVAILGLAYMAWRSTQAQNTHEATAPPPAAAPAPDQQPASPASTAAGTAKAEESNTAATQPATSPDSSIPKSENAVNKAPGPEANQEKAAAAARNAREIGSQSSPIGGSGGVGNGAAGNGSEELAIAQRYLGGTSGQGRDSSEAVKWLWKSIAKHNAEATLVLADLYMKGSGVAKNCDQARVLLDSAARRGAPGAGDRLRHLQAFGCQ
jgi:pyruvate/2-oxoglutarate dehydrogenase complex dihydrolipoamide acyltransferase (E2) component